MNFDEKNFFAGPSHELTSAEKDLILQTEMNFDHQTAIDDHLNPRSIASELGESTRPN